MRRRQGWPAHLRTSCSECRLSFAHYEALAQQVTWTIDVQNELMQKKQQKSIFFTPFNCYQNIYRSAGDVSAQTDPPLCLSALLYRTRFPSPLLRCAAFIPVSVRPSLSSISPSISLCCDSCIIVALTQGSTRWPEDLLLEIEPVAKRRFLSLPLPFPPSNVA